MKKVVKKTLKKRGRPKKEVVVEEKKKETKPEVPETPKVETPSNIISDPNASLVKEEK